MRTLACIVAFIGLTSAAFAQERKDGPGIRFQDDLAAKLEGDWKVTRSIRGREVPTRGRAEWALDHQFMRIELRDPATPSQYAADVYVGWSNERQRYDIHWMDIWGGHYSSRGVGTRHGDTIEFRFPNPDGDFFNTFAYDRAKDEWNMTLENSDQGGTRKLFAKERWERSR